MSVNVRFKIGQKKGITANYNVSNEEPIKTIFRINAPSAAFSSITGSPYDNANLKNALDAKADKSELDADVEIINQTINENYNTLDSKIDDVNSDLSGDISTLETSIQNEATTRAENDTLLQEDINTLSNDLTAEINNRATADTTLQGNINNIQNTINNYGDIVSYDASDFATYAQGQKADSALQPNDNISELVNDVGYITSASLPTVNNSSIVFQKNGTGFDTITLNQANNDTINITVPTQTSELTNNSGFITASALDGYATENFVTSQGYITGINESDVLDALGYTPYNASNPDGFITGITSNDVITALGYTPYNATNPSGYQANVIESIKVNNTTQTVVNKAVNITVPTTAAEVGALPDTTTINDLTTATQQAALNSGANTTNIGQIATNTSDIATIDGLIPSQATTSNQLADKAFVNSSIATNTANFIGTFNSVQDLENYSGTLTNNDYAFVVGTDSAGNTVYDRYKYTDATTPPSWIFEYELNNSSFTAAQWDAINSGITSGDVTLIGTALQPNDNISELTNDAGYITSASLPTVNNGTLTIQANGTSVGTFTANQSGDTTANITIPTDTSDLTNGAGYITGINSSDVTTALGYTPYNSTNPDGYITSSALTNYVDLSSAQNITGTKTFVGQKKIGFKQSSSSDKLGFTLYNNSGTEKGYLEFNPSNLVDSVPLMTLGNYASAAAGITHVGFRKYSSVSGASGAYNLLTPLIADARTPFNLTTTYTNFYLPLGVTNGTITVTTPKTGLLDISTLLPTVPTNISAFTNDSGYITSSALNSYQPLLVSGTNIKTINNVSALGSGNIDTSEIFIAEYGTTTFTEVLTAYNASKVIFCYDDNNNTYAPITNYTGTDFYFSTGLINNISASYTLDNNDSWDGGTTTLATVATSGSYNDLSNKPTIPAAQVNSDWDAVSGVAQILNKPTIPTVNDATLTITQGGVTKGTFTANASSNVTIALDAGGGGGATIDDTTPSTTTVYSSRKTQDLIDALVARIMALEANINGGNA